MHHYVISGLHVSSDLELPGAIPQVVPAPASDVTIRRGAVPATLNDATERGPTWDMAGEIFLLRVPRLARFRIDSGRDIAVEIEPGVTDHDAAGFVLGSAFGILLHQRGAIVLHGSAVARDGRAIAICGASGAGKSTLAAALCRDGCALVTDDLCVVALDAKRRPLVLPDGRQLKLWKQSIERLDLAQHQGAAVRQSFEKYFIEPGEARAQPSSLVAVYVLRDALPPLQPGIEGLALPDALRTLDYQAYRPRLRDKIGHRPNLLADAAAMLGHVQVFNLIRPRGFEHLPRTVADIQAHWAALDR